MKEEVEEDSDGVVAAETAPQITVKKSSTSSSVQKAQGSCDLSDLVLLYLSLLSTRDYANWQTQHLFCFQELVAGNL